MLASIKMFFFQLCYAYGLIYLLSTIIGIIIACIPIYKFVRWFFYIKKITRGKNKWFCGSL